MQNDIRYPDYNNSILRIPNSFLKHYGAKYHHETLKQLDDLLVKSFTNVVFIVFDGMGSDMLRVNLSKNDFLNRNKVADISSVFPCTTTAALATFQSGLTPIEHGWLGWSCYFKEIDRCVDLFSNKVSGMAEQMPASNVHMANTYMGYETRTRHA